MLVHKWNLTLQEKNEGEQVKVCTVVIVIVWKCSWFYWVEQGGCRSITE